jgi:hypothetical protein
MSKSPQELFKERSKRVTDTIAMRMPDRIPLEIAFGYFPAKFCGISTEAAYYDYDAWLAACKKTISSFNADISSVQGFTPGQALELIDPKNMMWPGHGATGTHQFIELETMKASEYDELLYDRGEYMLRTYIPRISGAAAGFSMLPDMSAATGGYYGAIALANALSTPELAASIERLQKAGAEFKKWGPKITQFQQELEGLGFPPYMDGMAVAPFDAISDNLRGMKGAMMDMYRLPDRLLEAVMSINKKQISRMQCAAPGRLNRVGMMLHRGSEGFMSIKQFERFYWPTLKATICALVEKGQTPLVFFEGDYTSRLEYLLELPRGKVFAHLDTTDINRAKDILKDHICISGNVPCSLLQTGSPNDVIDYTKKMIDVCGKGGGFVMSTRAPVDMAKPECVKALIDTTVEYGVYQ